MFVVHNRLQRSQPFFLRQPRRSTQTLDIDPRKFILGSAANVYSFPLNSLSPNRFVSWGQIDGCFYTQLIPKIVLNNKLMSDARSFLVFFRELEAEEFLVWLREHVCWIP